MPIKISNTNYTRALSSQNTDYLKSTVGEYGLLSVDFTAAPYIQPDRGGTISVINPNILRIDDGTTWYENGFKEGDQITWRFTLDNSATTITAITLTFDVEYIEDNVMYVENIYNVTSSITQANLTSYDISLPGNVQVGEQSIEYKDNLFYVSDVLTFKAVEVNYAKTPNTSGASGEVISAIDGTSPLFMYDLEGLPTSSKVKGEIINTKSGSGVIDSRVEYVGTSSIIVGVHNIAVRSYKLDILFNIALFGEQYNLDEDIDPEYFFDKETVKDGLIVSVFRDKDDRSILIKNEKKLKKGRVGYLNEKYNTTPTGITVSDVNYLDVNGNDDFSLSYNAESTIQFTLTGIDNLDSNTRFNAGLFLPPQSYQINKKKTLNNYYLTTGKNGFESFDWTTGDPRTNPFNYYNLGIYNQLSEGNDNDEARIDVTYLSFQQLSPNTIRVNLRFKPNAVFAERFEDVESPKFCVFVNVDGNECVQSDYQDFKEYINVLGTFDGAMKFFPSYLDIDTSNGIDFLDIKTTQDVLCKGYAKVLNAKTVESLDIKIEAVNGSLRYELDSYEFEAQENQTNNTINFNRISPISGLLDDRDTIKFQFDTTWSNIFYDSFYIEFPFRSRWEYWIDRLDTPDLWFNASLPNYGRNNDWIDYLNVTGTTIELSVYIGIEGGALLKSWDITPRDYNSSNNVTTKIEVFRTSDDQILWESTEADGFDYGYLIQDTDMYIIATHTALGGWDLDPSGSISIQRFEQNGQTEIRSTYDGYAQPNGEPLGNITKTISGNDMILRCDLNGSFASPDFNYLITSISYENYDARNGIGGIAGGNPFAGNFATNFNVPNIGTFQ